MVKYALVFIAGIVLGGYLERDYQDTLKHEEEWYPLPGPNGYSVLLGGF